MAGPGELKYLSSKAKIESLLADAPGGQRAVALADRDADGAPAEQLGRQSGWR